MVELSKSLPVEVNNSTIESHLPVDSHYSLPVAALNLIANSKSIKSSFMEIIFSADCTIGMVWGVGVAKVLWQ